MVTLSVDRKWEVQDRTDYAFNPSKEFEIGYAMNTKTASMRYHNLKGKFNMKLNRDGSPSFPCTQRCPKAKE